MDSNGKNSSFSQIYKKREKTSKEGKIKNSIHSPMPCQLLL